MFIFSVKCGTLNLNLNLKLEHSMRYMSLTFELILYFALFMTQEKTNPTLIFVIKIFLKVNC